MMTCKFSTEESSSRNKNKKTKKSHKSSSHLHILFNLIFFMSFSTFFLFLVPTLCTFFLIIIIVSLEFAQNLNCYLLKYLSFSFAILIITETDLQKCCIFSPLFFYKMPCLSLLLNTFFVRPTMCIEKKQTRLPCYYNIYVL